MQIWNITALFILRLDHHPPKSLGSQRPRVRPPWQPLLSVGPCGSSPPPVLPPSHPIPDSPHDHPLFSLTLCVSASPPGGDPVPTNPHPLGPQPQTLPGRKASPLVVWPLGAPFYQARVHISPHPPMRCCPCLVTSSPTVVTLSLVSATRLPHLPTPLPRSPRISCRPCSCSQEP